MHKSLPHEVQSATITTRAGHSVNTRLATKNLWYPSRSQAGLVLTGNFLAVPVRGGHKVDMKFHFAAVEGRRELWGRHAAQLVRLRCKQRNGASISLRQNYGLRHNVDGRIASDAQQSKEARCEQQSTEASERREEENHAV